MGITNGDFTDGLNGWTTITIPCESWLQSIVPEPPNVSIKAKACAISIYQDFTIDNTTLTFDWIYLEQYGIYGGCDAYSSYSLTRVSDGAPLKGGNLSGSECAGSFGIIIEDVSAYIGTYARIQFNLYPSGEWYSYEADLWIGRVCISPNLGSLDISSNPSGAKIFLDGNNTGFITPKIIDNVVPTSHTILLKKAGYYDSSTNVTTNPCRTNTISPTLNQIVGLINGTFDSNLSGWAYNPIDYWPYCNNATTRYCVWDNGRAKLFAGYCNIAGGAYIYQTFNIAFSTLKFDYQTSTPSPWRSQSSWSLTVYNPTVTVYNELLPLNGSGTIQKDVSAYIGRQATISFNTGGITNPNCYTSYCGGSDWVGQYIWIDNVNVFDPTCPTTPKYEGNTVTLQATPKDGIGPYNVVFKKNNSPIFSSLNVIENTLVTYNYILTNEDIRTAYSGTINFSVDISDSCPTGPRTCTDICPINIGCVAPVCNFVAT